MDAVLAHRCDRRAGGRVVHTVKKSDRGVADLQDPGAQEQSCASTGRRRDGKVELEGREAAAIVAQIVGRHAEGGTGMKTGAGKPMHEMLPTEAAVASDLP